MWLFYSGFKRWPSGAANFATGDSSEWELLAQATVFVNNTPGNSSASSLAPAELANTSRPGKGGRTVESPFSTKLLQWISCVCCSTHHHMSETLRLTFTTRTNWVQVQTGRVFRCWHGVFHSEFPILSSCYTVLYFSVKAYCLLLWDLV